MEEKLGKTEEMEYITKAAILSPSGEIFTDKNHQKIFTENFEKIAFAEGERIEGFMTNRGRFVSRQEASEIAFKAGQTKKLTNRLNSQDLDLE